MKTTLFVTLIGIAFGNILTLTEETLEKAVKQDKPILVKFFTPSCERCKDIDLEYTKLAEEVSKANEDFVIAELDASVHATLMEKLEVDNYPTIVLFANRTSKHYTGNYQMEDILRFMTGRPRFLSTLEDLKRKIEEKGNKCILTSNKEEDKKAFDTIITKEFELYYTNEEIAKQHFKETPCVVIEDGEVLYVESVEKLKQFLVEHSQEYVKVFDMLTSLDILYKRDKKFVLLMMPKGGDRQIDEVFRKLAISRQSEFTFGKFIKKNEDWSKKLAKYLRIKDEDIPRIEIVDPTEIKDVHKDRPKRYVFEGKVELGELQKFIDDYGKGVLVQFVEPEPEVEPEFVKEVTSDTFNVEVIDNDYDVLVNFYSDDCGFCKIFAPVYKALAETLKDSKKLKVLAVNAKKNKIAKMIVSSYPTIYLYPSGKKDYPILFEDEIKGRKNLIKFLKKHCTHPIYEMKEDL